jgi:predicted metal-dependent peptidase
MSEDPFDNLEKAVRQKDLEERALKQLQKASVALTLGRRRQDDTKSPESIGSCVFFSTLALRLKREIAWDQPTLATDGKRLLYNPEFVMGLTLDETEGVVVHETMHVVCKHHSRPLAQPLKDNVAGDLAINSLIRQAGFVLPKNALMPGQRPQGDTFPKHWADAIATMKPGLSREDYYALLPDPPGKDEQGGSGPEGGTGDGDDEGDGEGQDPGGCGTTRKPGDGSQSALHQADADADVAVAEAQQTAQRRGTLSAGLGRLVEQALQPVVDWKEVLREFISRYAKNDYSWARPNRRFISQGLYLPGLRSEELGDLVVAVDTSGSIGGPILDKFAGELQGMLAAYEVAITILYHDSAICHTQTWKSSDGPLVLEPKGGGGTSHRPVFDWIEQSGMDPSCLVCLTDMYSEFPESGPAFPTLWCSIVPGMKAPFGQLVEIQ